MTHDITITLDLSPYWGAMDFNISADELISSGNLVINWGDNTSETASPHEDIEHTYQSGNTYTITIDGVSDIGDYFLSQNGDVTEVTLSSNITTIGNMFCIGTHITEMIIPNSITSIGDNFCDGTDITEIVIPENVTSIGGWFCAGSALNAIHIPSNVTTIGGCFCYMCSNLRAVSFSTGLTEVGEDFVGKTLVSRLEFPEGLSISRGFSDAPNINTIIYPSSIDDTGLLIFDNDYFAPQKIVFKSHTPPATANRWENFDGIVYVPEGCINSYIEYAIETNTFPVDSSYYKENLTLPRALDKLGTLMRTNLKKQGIETQRNDGLTTLANKVSDIQDFNDIFEFDSSNDYASDGFSIMYASEDIKRSYFTLKVPSTITTLGDYSFDGFHGMRICEIPSSVTSIGNYVFNFNQSLEKIIFKGTTPPTATSRSSFVTNSNSLQNIPTTCVIEVPCSALSAYKSATNYPDPTVYTYQCILFDDKKDHNNSTIAPPITVYDSSQNGVTKINYDSETNSYELFGTSQDKVIYPINQLGGKSNFKMTCEVKLDNSSNIPGIGFGVTPPELSLTGGGQIDDTYADIIYIRSLANGNTQMVYYKSKRSAVTATTIQTISGEYTDWIRLIVNVDSSNGLSAQCEELDGTVLATITNKTISSQISDRNYGIFLRDGGDASKIQYIRNIKCIGY